MSRILFFALMCILIAAGESHRRNRHKLSRSRHPKRIYDQVSDDIISADRKLNDLCYDNNNTTAKIYYEPTEVRIEANLQGYLENTIAVKIKHRVIFIYAETEGRKRDKNVFIDVKILSEACDTKSAVWTFNNGIVVVKMLYKKQTPTCIEVDDDEICVPKLNTNTFQNANISEGSNEGSRTGENEIDARDRKDFNAEGAVNNGERLSSGRIF